MAHTPPLCSSESLSSCCPLRGGFVLRPTDCQVLGPVEEGGLSIPVSLQRSEEKFFVSRGPYLSCPKSVPGNGSWVPTIFWDYLLHGLGREGFKKTHTRTNSSFLLFFLLGDLSWALVSLFSTLETLTNHLLFYFSSSALRLHSLRTLLADKCFFHFTTWFLKRVSSFCFWVLNALIMKQVLYF